MSREYVIVTDDSCDLTDEHLARLKIPCLNLKYIIDGKEYKRTDRSFKELYDDMRAGKMPTTTQVNVQEFTECFEEIVNQGKDVLYLAFSSGLSGTYNSGHTAAKELISKYPEAKIIAVDSLSASIGQGLFVDKVNAKKEAGATIEEATEYGRWLATKIVHAVVVDDLMHLHRGGRISRGSAIAGSLIGIKPIIHVDDQGKLESVAKVRGRKNGLMRIVEDIQKLVEPDCDTVYISHGDTIEDAEFVLAEIKSRFPIKHSLIEYVGPVIGSHTGPGVIALTMVGRNRGF